jgi:hypothetical protein
MLHRRTNILPMKVMMTTTTTMGLISKTKLPWQEHPFFAGSGYQTVPPTQVVEEYHHWH